MASPQRVKPEAVSQETVVRMVREDWHAPLPGEAPCGPDEWRKKDRRVIKIASMETDHLVHCFRFASTKRHHRSKLDALQAELAKRQGGAGRILDIED